jgi:hypothetical protein
MGSDLRGLIGGKEVVFHSGVILGNRRHGYALQAFESGSSSKQAEVDARIDSDLERGRAMPITLIFLQIPDDGPKSVDGFRSLECQGKGDLLLDKLPALPKRLPRDEVEAGEARGSLSIRVICTRDSRSYGAFTIEGRVAARVVITPPDL